MSFQRVWAVFLRYFFMCMKLDQLSDLFYWPAVDIFLWGITSVWIQRTDPQVPGVALAILTGLVFWQVVWRANYEVGVNILQEFWNRNLMNLFATPLKVGEWMGGMMLLSLFKVFLSLFFGALLVFLLYALNVFTMGWAFLPFMGSLMMSGWAIGFFAGGIVLYYGQRLQMLAWMIAYVFSPFCAIFYPVSALPHWGQLIAKALPMAHIFEGMREIINSGHFPLNQLVLSFALNGIYLTASIAFFIFMFEKSRAKGLGRLE